MYHFNLAKSLSRVGRIQICVYVQASPSLEEKELSFSSTIIHDGR
jgi:hypothetical protein